MEARGVTFLKLYHQMVQGMSGKALRAQPEGALYTEHRDGNQAGNDPTEPVLLHAHSRHLRTAQVQVCRALGTVLMTTVFRLKSRVKVKVSCMVRGWQGDR